MNKKIDLIPVYYDPDAVEFVRNSHECVPRRIEGNIFQELITKIKQKLGMKYTREYCFINNPENPYEVVYNKKVRL